MFSFLGRDERLFRLQRAFDRPRVLAVLDRVAPLIGRAICAIM